MSLRPAMSPAYIRNRRAVLYSLDVHKLTNAVVNTLHAWRISEDDNWTDNRILMVAFSRRQHTTPICNLLFNITIVMYDSANIISLRLSRLQWQWRT